METPTYSGEIDIDKNMETINDIKNPQPWDDERREEEAFWNNHHMNETPREAAERETLESANETLAVLTEHGIDENQKETVEAIRYALKENDDAELGRMFRHICKEGFKSYLLLVHNITSEAAE